MKKQVKLLIRLILSIGITLFSTTQIIATLPPIVQQSGELFPTLSPILTKVLPAIVSIQVEKNRQVAETKRSLFEYTNLFAQFNKRHPDKKHFPFTFNDFFTVLKINQQDKFNKKNQNKKITTANIGSGVIINANKGYILTSRHLVQSAEKILVRLNDGKEYHANLVAGDEPTDLALIQVPQAKEFTQIKIANSDHLKIGDFVIAIGHPFGLKQSASAGIISAIGRNGMYLSGIEDYLQTDAAINSGNTGGALINLNGELIGINSAILSAAGGNIGIGFAIPSNIAMKIAKELTEFGQVRRGELGVKGLTMNEEIANLLKYNRKDGAFITEVEPKSSAEESGIKAGDIIVMLNKQPVTNFMDLRAKIAMLEPEQNITMDIIRNNQPLTVKVKLKNKKTVFDFHTLFHPLTGVELGNGITENGMSGVKVEDIEKDSIAFSFGLQKNDIIVEINKNRVKNISDMREILEKHPSLLILKVKRAKRNAYCFLR